MLIVSEFRSSLRFHERITGSGHKALAGKIGSLRRAAARLRTTSLEVIQMGVPPRLLFTPISIVN